MVLVCKPFSRSREKVPGGRMGARAQRAAPAPRNRYATPSQDRLHRKHALPCARASRSARPRQNPAMTDKPFAPACERNREPILAVLREHFAGSSHVLEVASGTGPHAVHFAPAMPWLRWQRYDREAHRTEERPVGTACDTTYTPRGD